MTSSRKTVEIAALATILVAVVLRASRTNRFDEDPFSPSPAPPAVAAPPTEAPIEGAHFARTFAATSFRRGNLHTHTNQSDGDSSPVDIYSWYRDHGYDFVAITDHNTFTDPADYPWLQDSHFIAIGGEEVTMQGAGRQVHMNALCTDHRLAGGRFQTAKEALVHGVSEIREAGGVSLINHPNFTFGLKASDLPAAFGAQLLEIYSGHPYVASLGDGTHPSHEAMWDMALTAGLDFTGVAVDDTHHLRRPNRTRASRPGRAWVEVFAETLDEASICHALRYGLLYASTGPSLRRIEVGEDTYTIWPADPEVTVQFIGSGGRLLAQRTAGAGEPVDYKLAGREGYVRVRLTNKAGKTAWMPAVRVQLPIGQANATRPEKDERPPG
jgi:hypothetical protein